MRTNRLFALALLAGTLATAPALASTIVVTAASPDGWVFSNQDNAPHVNASGDFEAGLAPPGFGTGSAQFIVGDTLSSEFLEQAFSPTSADSLDSLSYQTYVITSNAGSGDAASLEFDLYQGATYKGRLVFDPGLMGTVSLNSWQTWDASSTDLAWYFSKAGLGSGSCTITGSYCTLSQAQTILDGLGIDVSNVYFKVGSGQTSFNGNVDDFTFNDTTYDFEPAAVPEPADIAIFGSALALLGLMAFRRRRNAATV